MVQQDKGLIRRIGEDTGGRRLFRTHLLKNPIVYLYQSILRWEGWMEATTVSDNDPCESQV